MKLADLVIFEDDDLIALDKPSGLLSIPDREGKEVSLKTMLMEKYGHILTVHRLDKDTSGLIIFAKNEASHRSLSIQFEERHTKKIYIGFVNGSLQPPTGTIDSPIAQHPAMNGTMIIHRNGKESLTAYEVVEDFKIYSYVQFRIHTGRTHQIRVLMKEIGHPIVCDTIYGDGKPVFVSAIKSKFKLARNVDEEQPILGRLALHAFQLSVAKTDGSILELEAPVPKNFTATIQQLRKRKSR